MANHLYYGDNLDILWEHVRMVQRHQIMDRFTPFGAFLIFLTALLAGCATGDMPRTPLFSPPLVYEGDEVTYEEHWFEGNKAIKASAGTVKAGALIAPNKELPSAMYAVIILANASDAPILFSPQDIIMRGVDKTGEYTVKVYSPEEFENMIKPSKTWGTILGLLAARDYPAVPVIIEKRMQAADATFQQTASALLRKQTLAPHSSYTGAVGFQNRRSNQYRLYVPFGPKSFMFTFDMQ